MFLLDTDVIIYALKSEPHIVRWFEEKSEFPKAFSVITYGELVYGAMNSAHVQSNLARVRRIAELFPVLDISRAIVETFGSLKVELNKKGKPLDDFDLLIGSTALVYNYRLVTNNVRHFQRIPGLLLENWKNGKG